VDWDWDDGPPRDAPRGTPRDDPRPPEESAPDDAADSPTFADAIEHFDRSAPAPEDDERTQLIQMPPAAGAASPSGPPPSPSGLERPRPGAIETVRRGTPAAASAAYSADQAAADPRRPRPPRDRAARARRRKQVRRRRLVALAVIVVIVVLLVVLVVRGCGGSPAAGQTTSTFAPPTVAIQAPAAAQTRRVAVALAPWAAEDRHLVPFTRQV
jgi:hypothetical protein